MRIMKRFGKLGAFLCLCAVLFSGCGQAGAKVPDVVDTPSVAVDGEGAVTLWQVGLFDKSDYVVSELQSMAVEEAARFNTSAGKDAAVAVEKVEALEDGSGKVVVTYRFDGWQSCTEFMKSQFVEEQFFCGTVGEAFNQGYGTGATVKSVKDGSLLTEEQLRADTESRLIVTDMKANVYCPGKVNYISEGAEVNGDGSVNTAGAEGTVYILYK